MSKILDYLKNAQAQRENCLSSARPTLPSREPELPVKETPISRQPSPQNVDGSIATNKMIYSLIFVLFFISMTFNIGLFAMFRGSRSEKNKTLTKLNVIEESLNANAKQINVLAANIKELDRDTNAKITELSRVLNTHSSIITSFTKDTDMLSRKIDELANRGNTK